MTTCYRCKTPITWSGKGWSDDVEGLCRDGQRLTVYASSAFVMDVVLTDERIRGAMV